MPDPDPISLHADPLSDGARKERRNLVIASVLGLLVSRVGLVPTRVAILGIEFSSPSQRAFVFVVGAVIAYFLVAFVIYGLSDFFAWRKRYQDYIEQIEVSARNWTQEDQQEYEELHADIPRATWIYSGSKPLAVARVLFEFLLPILIGCVSLILLCIR